MTVRAVEIGSATVELDPAQRTTADLARAIEAAGYQLVAHQGLSQ